MPKLISVHVAKAGGSSLLKAFRDAFGDALLADYADNPADPLSQRNLDPATYFSRSEVPPDNIACVHGHFHPGKYAIKDGMILSAILRYPVENIISIYSFWKTLARGNDRLHDYFLDHKLSVLETAKLPLLRRLFSETYFGGFDMKRFDLVGRHETRDEALRKLSDLIGVKFNTSLRENVTEDDDERRAMAADAGLHAQLEDILADDIRFYERYAR